MKCTISLLLIALTASFVISEETVAPAEDPAREAVASPDADIEADITDIAEGTGDPRGHSDEKDVTGLVMALQQKEVELQAATEEIARLRSWIQKIKTANEAEKGTMHYNMGCMYKLYKQFDKAEIEFKKALKISPNDSSIHYNLGILYEDDLDDKTSAAKHYERFLELSPSEEDRAQVQEWLSSLQ